MRTTVLVATPAADLYGSNLQLLQSVSAMRAHGWQVVVVTPTEGPLVGQLRARGAGVTRADFPVLRRADASLRGLTGLAMRSPHAVMRIRRLIAAHRPAVVYVNTITLPWWLVAARSTGTPTICHVHEAEQADPRPVRFGLTVPLWLATLCIANSRSTAAELAAMQPRLGERVRVVYNGVEGPDGIPKPAAQRARTRLVVVGRLSARKAPHIAIETLSRLLAAGYDVELDICGTPFDSQGGYVEQLTERIKHPDVVGRVRLRGHVSPIWSALEDSDILVAPSLGESLGNAVIEAQLAGRPVVATAVQGHLESVSHEDTGLLVPLADPTATADAVGRLIDNPDLADRLAHRARTRSREQFSTATYNRSITSVIESAGHNLRAATVPSIPLT